MGSIDPIRFDSIRFDSIRRGEGRLSALFSQPSLREELDEVAEDAVDGGVPGARRGELRASAEHGLVRLKRGGFSARGGGRTYVREGGRGERVRGGGMDGEGRREREGARSIDRTNRVCARDAEGRDGAVCRASDAPEAAPGRGKGTGTCPRAWTSSSRGSAAMRNRRSGRGVSVARGGRGRRRGGGFGSAFGSRAMDRSRGKRARFSRVARSRRARGGRTRTSRKATEAVAKPRVVHSKRSRRTMDMRVARRARAGAKAGVPRTREVSGFRRVSSKRGEKNLPLHTADF